MKRLFRVLLLTLSLSLCGCNKIYFWEFEKAASEVKQISIIYIETHLHNAEEIVNISPEKIINVSLVNEFYQEVTNLKMEQTFNMELPFSIGYCFLIDYGNNNYCILSIKGSSYVYYDEATRMLVNESTDMVFNNEDFLSLLNKYLKDEVGVSQKE